MLELLFVLLWAIFIGKCEGLEGAVSPFVMEPGNVTVTEGESTKLNCTMAVISEDIATWVINGLEYYWSDFAIIEVFSFDLRDNSLTIHNSPRTLDGASFQCILDNHESKVGYLTVLHLSPTAPTSNSSNSTSTGVPLDTFSSSPIITLSITSTETTISTPQNSVIIIGSTVGAVALIVLTFMCCIAFCLLRRLCISKSDNQLAPPEDDFTMDQNVLYIETLDIKTARNSAYMYTHQFSKSP